MNDVLGVHVQALNLRLQRSEIIAANLANEDTPRFQARDFDFGSEMNRLNSDAGTAFGGGAAPQLQYRVPSQASLDGNTVDLSTEQTEFSKNAMEFQTSLTFLNMKFRGLKQAFEGR